MFVEILTLLFSATVIYISLSRPKKIQQLKKTESKIKEIRFEGRFYDVTDWARRHPGGRVIEFYINNQEDASIAIQQFHNRSAKRVSAILKSFKSRPIPESIDQENDAKLLELTSDFYKLFRELQDEGLFKPGLIYTMIRLSEIACLGALGLYLIYTAESIAMTAFAVIILHIFQFRSAFLTHELGHNSITGKPRVDRMIQSSVMGLVHGHSSAWWNSAHNRHHAMPQRLHHDVDLETLPLIAFNKAVIGGDWEKYTKLVHHQGSLSILYALIGRLAWNLHVSPRFAWKNGKYYELIAFALHYLVVYQVVGLLPYLAVVMINSPFMLFTFSMSHTHTPVAEEPRHWLEYCSVHTINVEPSWWCDYVMGNLNYQIEHHLFPTLPQFNLRGISGRVRKLMEKHDLPYTCLSYGDALQKVCSNLSETSRELDEQAKLAGQKLFWVSPKFC